MTDWASLLLNKTEIDVACRRCSVKSKQTLGRLKDNPEITCPACGLRFTINSEQFREGMRKVNKAIEDLRGGLGSK